MPDVKILPLAPEHISQIAALEREIFTDDPWSEQAFSDELGNRFSVSFTALCGDTAVGYIIGNCIFGDGCINNIAVAENMRGQKTASALLQAFLDAADARQISLEVRQSNTAAKRLYEKFGFKTVGVRKRFYINPTEDADLMVKKDDKD